MKEKTIRGRCLYTTKGAAREYSPVGCNFYRGCPLQCDYCYNRHGLTKNVLGVDHAVLDDCFAKRERRPMKYRDLGAETYAMHVFRHELEKNLDYFRETGIMFSFSTDPMLDDTDGLTWAAATAAVLQGVPVTILTKNAGQWTRYDWFTDQFNVTHRDLVSFGFTLTGRDDLEQGAAARFWSNAARIEAMKRVRGMGYRVWASIEPVVDFASSYAMIEGSLNCCDHYKIGLMSGTKKGYYGSMQSLVKFINDVNGLFEGRSVTVYWKQSVRNELAGRDEYLALLDGPQTVGPGFDWFRRLSAVKQ